MPSATSTELARRHVITIFLVQGFAGFAAMVYVALVRRAQTAEILHSLGAHAFILIGIFIAFSATVALLKFELTEQIYVSLLTTACIAFYPLLGPVLTSWLAVLVAMGARILAVQQLGPIKTDTRDPVAEYVKALAGQFPTYGLPVLAASMLYERLGGETPVVHSSPDAALKVALGGVALIVTNNIMMFMPARAYGYSVKEVLRLDVLDMSIYLVALPYSVALALAYGPMGWGTVAALAFTGAVANLVARNLAKTRSKSVQLLQRLASLTNIGKTISLRFTTDQLLMAIYTECKKIVDCTLFTIALLDESTNELSFELDVRDESFLPKDRIPVGEGLNSWVVRHHQPRIRRHRPRAQHHQEVRGDARRPDLGRERARQGIDLLFHDSAPGGADGDGMSDKTILYVEDNEFNRKIVRQLLAKTSYRLVEAMDGEAGVAAALAAPPDLILMDIQLPKMSGLDATRQLRGDARTAAVPIIVVTSFALSGDDQKAKAAGATAYLAKPYSPRELLAQIRAIVPDA